MRVTTGLKGWRKDSGEWSWTPEITIEHDGIPQLMDSAEVARINESLEQQRDIIRAMVEAKTPAANEKPKSSNLVLKGSEPAEETKCVRCGGPAPHQEARSEPDGRICLVCYNKQLQEKKAAEAPKPEVKCIKCGTICNERVSASTKKPYMFCPKCKDNRTMSGKSFLDQGAKY